MYRVLLVDDEDIVLEGLKRFGPWQAAGFGVVGTATSVALALVFLAEHPVDLVIVDVQMPVQSGLDLLTIMQSQYPTVATMILSSYSDFNYAQQALRLGALDYLTKPVDFKLMQTALEKVAAQLDQRQSESLQQEVTDWLAQSMIMNLIMGYHYDQLQFQQVLDDRLPVTVVAINQPVAISDAVRQQLKSQFAPCRLVAYREHQLLMVLESTYSEQTLRTLLDTFNEHYLPTPTFIGVSQFNRHYQDLRLGVTEAIKAMHYQTARANQEALLFNAIKALYLDANQVDDQVSLQQLIQMFMTPDQSPQFVNQFSQTLLAFDHSRVPLNQIKRFCTALILELTTPLQNMQIGPVISHELVSEMMTVTFGSQSVTELIDQLVPHFEHLLAAIHHQEAKHAEGEMIGRVKAYIQMHFADNITLSSLADIFYINSAYLSRLFKQKTGTNFIDYLTEQRVAHAKELLQSPQLKIYEVAGLVGYDNPRYFAKVFREATGQSPNDYRSSHTSA